MRFNAFKAIFGVYCSFNVLVLRYTVLLWFLGLLQSFVYESLNSCLLHTRSLRESTVLEFVKSLLRGCLLGLVLLSLSVARFSIVDLLGILCGRDLCLLCLP